MLDRRTWSTATLHTGTVYLLANHKGQYDMGISTCVLVTPRSPMLTEHHGEQQIGTDTVTHQIGDTTPYEHCVRVEWPGRRSFSSGYRRHSWGPAPPWVGSLLYHGKDPSGQMYRRNRFYDPSSGRFTQEDPIGIAGGLNVYGYAAGDPISYADPFGLYITCITRAACALWNKVYAQAYAASRSRDQVVRRAGGRLLATMNALAESDEQVQITVQTRSFGRRVLDWGLPTVFPVNVSGSCVRVDRSCPEANGYAIVIDPGWSKGRRVNAETRLVHEIGHVDARMSDDEANSDAHSVAVENDYRTISGCRTRWSHNDAGPPCEN